MSKKLKSQTPEVLIKTRSKYRRHNIIGSFLFGFLVIFLVFAYLFLVTGYHGYGEFGPLGFMSKWTFLANLPYFEEAYIISIFDFFLQKNGLKFSDLFSGETLYRFLILVGTIVIAVLISVLYGVFHGRKLNRKYEALYLTVLAHEASSYGISIKCHSKKELLPYAVSADETLKQVAAVDCVKKSIATFSGEIISWDGLQTTYKYKGQVRNGYLLSTCLESPRTDGFIQLRNYGCPIISEVHGIKLEKYGFADNNNLSRFVCYSNLDRTVYRIIDSQIAQQIFDLQHFLSSSLVLNVDKDRFSIFIDGFQLTLTRPLKKKIKVDLIGQQAKALSGLNQIFTAISKAFTSDGLDSSVRDDEQNSAGMDL